MVHRNPAIFCLLTLLVAFPLASAQTSPQQPPSTLSDIYAPFLGQWTGALEYRDFSTDQRVTLPTWLECKLSPDNRTMQFRYTYDDGPNKVVEEISLIAIDPRNHTLLVSSDRDKSADTYDVSGLEKFASDGGGALQLTGTAVENGKKVDVRITIKVTRNAYHYEKQTRPSGGEFAFRDAYNFTRRDPPKSSR